VDDDWGGDGELQLNIFVNKNEMELNESINLTYELINIGNTDLRILLSTAIQFSPLMSNENSPVVFIPYC
jgi:hypothetical protein